MEEGWTHGMMLSGINFVKPFVAAKKRLYSAMLRKPTRLAPISIKVGNCIIEVVQVQEQSIKVVKLIRPGTKRGH